MKKNIAPGVVKKLIQRVFNSFSGGTIKDPPASEISDCLADSTNITAYPTYFEGRTGCIPYGVAVGAIADRSGYTAHKEGNVIVSDSGDIFSQSDIGQYFNFGSYSELITGYVDAQNVVGSDTTYRYGVECSIVAMPACFFFHKVLKRWVIVTDNLKYAEVDMSAWNDILCISNKKIGIGRCDYSEYLRSLYLFTNVGLFKADIDDNVMYQANINPPPSAPTVVDTGTANRYRYLISGTRLKENGSVIDRQSVDSISLETGTNLPSGDQDYVEFLADNEISVTTPGYLNDLYLPLDASGTPERHITHYTIWRTEDLESINPDDLYKSEYNDPNRFIWSKDLRAAAAFYGSLNGTTGVFTASEGQFDLADRHSYLKFENGLELQIDSVISDETALLDISGYTNGDLTDVGAAIGNGRVWVGSITNGVLTLTTGAILSSDVGNTLWCSDGDRLFILDTSGTLSSNVTKPTQGFTISPTSRNYCDVIEDTLLHARKDFYTCRSRFRRPLPNCNVGSIITGFIVAAYRGESDIYYSNIDSGYSQLIGQYVPNKQTKNEVKDSIQTMVVFESTLAIICATSTWGVTVGISSFDTLPSSTEAVAIMAGCRLIDKHRGCLDIDSIAEVENGLIELVTNEPGGEAIRYFDGISYSKENHIEGRISKVFDNTLKKSMAVYDGLLGYVIWRKQC